MKDTLGTESVSWLCVLAALPFGALGFVRYNGMSAERFAAAYIKSELLMPKYLCCRGENVYYLALGDYLACSRPAKMAEVEKARRRKPAKRKHKGGRRHD